MTLPLSGESAPSSLGAIGSPVNPDAEAAAAAEDGEVSFGDTLASLVEEQPEQAPAEESADTPAVCDLSLLLTGWQLPAKGTAPATDGIPAEEDIPVGEKHHDDETTVVPEAVLALLAAQAAPPIDLSPAAAVSAAAEEAPGQDVPAASLSSASGLDGQTGANPSEVGVGPTAGTATLQRPEAQPEPQVPESPFAAAAAAAAEVPVSTPVEATEGTAPEARESASSSMPDVTATAAESAQPGPGDPAAGGGSQDSPSEPGPQSQAPNLSLAGRRFAARIEEFAQETERASGGGAPMGRVVTVDSQGPAARLPAAPVVAPPAPPAEPAAANIAELVQSIRIQTRQGISEATVRLQPDHLGEVTISIKVDRGAVSAVVHAEAGDVCEWLRGQEDSIRSSLSDQGLQLERFVVQRDRSRERREAPEQQGRQRQRRQPDAETPRFEVAA